MLDYGECLVLNYSCFSLYNHSLNTWVHPFVLRVSIESPQTLNTESRLGLNTDGRLGLSFGLWFRQQTRPGCDLPTAPNKSIIGGTVDALTWAVCALIRYSSPLRYLLLFTYLHLLSSTTEPSADNFGCFDFFPKWHTRQDLIFHTANGKFHFNQALYQMVEKISYASYKKKAFKSSKVKKMTKKTKKIADFLVQATWASSMSNSKSVPG